jgi:predicted nucleic acid-binding protein
MKSDNILVDTTIWVNFLRGLDSSLEHRLSAWIREERVFTAEIIIVEILKGARSDKEFNLLREDFSALPLLTINQPVWELAGKTSYKLRKRGADVPLTDILIAATAIHYQCRLLHADKHFSLIADHSLLKIMD